ncbi:hypothetical protein [Mycobacterium colombiense]|uniref:Uncharacterized protein n=1 Tax=Mycobacterium colombiense TaxID=339268 RepID=A0A1A2Z139_9MYCO|nr:hypothetical protein [Mycobacterium colombiense]OBI43343.1 hypothetical protein A5708_18795 [Mycobacterium colombiense]
MVQTTRNDPLESSEHLHAVAQAVLAGQRAEQARQAAGVARRLAADSVQAAVESLGLSAVSQDRTAQAFEDSADRGGRRSAFLRAHAAEHRRFAEEDRRMAQELRRRGRNWLAAQARLDRWTSES